MLFHYLVFYTKRQVKNLRELVFLKDALLLLVGLIDKRYCSGEVLNDELSFLLVLMCG